MKKKPKHKSRNGNPMLNKIHQQEKAVFDKKLDIALQMGFDAACLAARDVFQLGEGRFLKFAQSYKLWINSIAGLISDDSGDLEYSTTKIDEALKKISGDNFVPWDVRYP